MILGMIHTALIVLDYDEAKKFYCEKLGFRELEDRALPGGKRWVRIAAPGGRGTEILLSRAVDEKQRRCVGNQTGGRVLFFLATNDLDSDFLELQKRGVEFVELPRDEEYGRVAVFVDLYGNRLDLIQFKNHT